MKTDFTFEKNGYFIGFSLWPLYYQCHNDGCKHLSISPITCELNVDWNSKPFIDKDGYEWPAHNGWHFYFQMLFFTLTFGWERRD